MASDNSNESPLASEVEELTIDEGAGVREAGGEQQLAVRGKRGNSDYALRQLKTKVRQAAASQLGTLNIKSI